MASMVLGEIRLFAFPRIPRYWLPCDGSLQSVAEHPALFKLIGSAYGGDGKTTFAVPNLSGRTPLPYGRSYGYDLTERHLGEVGGFDSLGPVEHDAAGTTGANSPPGDPHSGNHALPTLTVSFCIASAGVYPPR